MTDKYGEGAGRRGFELWFILRQARGAMGLVPLGHKVGLASAAIMMALAGACGALVPILVGKLVDGVQRNATPHASFVAVAGRILALIGGALLLREALNVGRRHVVENSCARIERALTIRLVSHLLRVDLTTLARTKVGALDSRIARSTEGVIRFLRLAFLDFFPAVVTGVLALSTALWKNWIVGAVMAGVIPISLALTLGQLASQRGVRLRLMRLCEEMDGMIVEQLGGVEYIRAAHTEGIEARRLQRTATKRSVLAVRHYFEMSLFGCAKALNEGAFHILLLACATFLATRGAISVGDILTLSMLFFGVMAPLGEVHRVIDEGHESALRVMDFLEMLKEPIDASYRVRSHRHPCVEGGQPVIAVRNLKVDMVSQRGGAVRVIDDVSFDVRHGETIGIAGRSGSGKSTFAKVLLNLVHSSGGEVLIGGIPLSAIPRAKLARLFGYVGQQPFVFAGTIAENIAYGPRKTSLSEIRRVAAMAHLHDEIVHMPRGYHAQLAERGRNLSGGQCQRVALARTLLHDPPILIFDEATSALDNIGERHVQRALEARRIGRTVLLIAHRLSTLRNADRILVFDSGRIVETGKFGELVRAGGVFSELVRSARE